MARKRNKRSDKPNFVRNTEFLTAVLHCKGGPMKDKRTRRKTRRSWKREEW